VAGFSFDAAKPLPTLCFYPSPHALGEVQRALPALYLLLLFFPIGFFFTEFACPFIMVLLHSFLLPTLPGLFSSGQGNNFVINGRAPALLEYPLHTPFQPLKGFF